MKILLATSAAVPVGGGIASYNQELVKAFTDDNEIHLLTASNETNVSGYTKCTTLFEKAITSYSYCRELVSQINNEHFDLIINSNSTAIAYLAPFVNAPIITVSHFVNGICADCAGYNTDFVNSIIALSNYGKQYLEDKFQITDKSKVHVIYNFVHPKDIVIEKKRTQPLIIVYPGGTSIKKSADVVMETAYRLKKSDLKFKFIWLGGTRLPSDKMSLFGISETTQMLHGDDRFELVGRVSREMAEEYMSKANIFLLPSRGEGCPMTLLEAMRVGCIPVVSDAHHGSREILEMCSCGKIVRQDDSKALFDALEDIILHHDAYSDCYDKTKEFSKESLSPYVWKEQMDAIIRFAVNKNKKTMEMSESSFNASLNGYRKLQKNDRLQMQIASALNRIKMDWLYVKWMGWK